MNIVLNGKGHEVPDGATVLALLEMVALRPGRVAVEVNGQVVRREDFQRVTLGPGDRVEVVHFVSGG